MANFVFIYTYVAESEQVDMGLKIEAEKVEISFNPEFVVYVEGKAGGQGCEISMINGEWFYVDETRAQVMEMIAKATIHGNYSGPN